MFVMAAIGGCHTTVRSQFCHVAVRSRCGRAAALALRCELAFTEALKQSHHAGRDVWHPAHQRQCSEHQFMIMMWHSEANQSTHPRPPCNWLASLRCSMG